MSLNRHRPFLNMTVSKVISITVIIKHILIFGELFEGRWQPIVSNTTFCLVVPFLFLLVNFKTKLILMIIAFIVFNCSWTICVSNHQLFALSKFNAYNHILLVSLLPPSCCHSTCNSPPWPRWFSPGKSLWEIANSTCNKRNSSCNSRRSPCWAWMAGNNQNCIRESSTTSQAFPPSPTGSSCSFLLLRTSQQLCCNHILKLKMESIGNHKNINSIFFTYKIGNGFLYRALCHINVANFLMIK